MKITHTLAALLTMKQDELLETLKGEVTSAESKFIGLGKIIAVLDNHRPSQVPMSKWIGSKIPGMTPQVIGHGYKSAGVFMRMVDTAETDPAPIGSGKITEALYDGCKIGWLITIYAILNGMEKQEKPSDYQLTIRERICVLIRSKEDGIQSALDCIKTEVLPAAEKSAKDPTEKEKELAEQIAAKDKEMAEAQARHDEFRKQAEENGRVLMARIAELEAELKLTTAELHNVNRERVALQSLTGQLSELAGTLCANANAEQCAVTLPLIDSLPETLRTKLATVVSARIDELDAAEEAINPTRVPTAGTAA
jgi:hypothetical protein